MGSLIQVFLRYGGFITFLTLEVIALYLVVTYNANQRNIWSGSHQFYTDKINDRVDNWGDYLDLAEEVAALKAENAELRGYLDMNLYDDVSELDTLLNDTTIQQFVFVDVEVINKNMPGLNNVFVINKGTSHGLDAHMGVISADGVVGITVGCTSHFCRVMTINHQQATTSVAFKRTRAFGSLRWAGGDRRTFKLEFIPKYATVRLGDTIVTSGYSNYYPANYPIGVVEDFSIPEGNNYYNIRVKSFNDPVSLEYAYVVKNLLNPELDSLKTLAE